MDDLISRQAAIDGKISIQRANGVEIYTDEAVPVEHLKNVPAADVVPVAHGKWKKIGVWGRVYRCSQCGNFLDFDAVNAGRGDANFCPNCGAKMGVGENADEKTETFVENDSVTLTTTDKKGEQ